MSDSQTSTESRQSEPIVNGHRLEAMTEKLIVSMRKVRDLIASRGEALGEYGSELGEHQVRLAGERELLSRRAAELTRREDSIAGCEDHHAAAERELAEKIAGLDTRRERLEAAAVQLDQRCAEATLQEAQLECERDELARSKAALDDERAEIDENRKTATARLEELAAREAALAIREFRHPSGPCGASGQCDGSGAAIPGTHVEVRRCERLALYESIDRAVAEAGRLVPYVAYRNQKREWLVVVRGDDLSRLADCVLLMSTQFNADDDDDGTR